jgi:hypothetical protein
VDFKKGYYLFPKFIYILKESQYNFLFFVVLAQSFEHQDEFVVPFGVGAGGGRFSPGFAAIPQSYSD